MMTQELTAHSLDEMIDHWLKSKYLLSHSKRTGLAYQETLLRFRSYVQRNDLDLDSPAQDVARLALDWLAMSHHPSKKEVSAATFNQRRAILSSFYTFAIRNEYLTTINPILRIDRSRNEAKSKGQSFDMNTLQRKIGAIDRTTLVGLRDYALIEFAAMTGKRDHELRNLTLGKLSIRDNGVFIQWDMLKGGKAQERLYEYPHAANLLAYLIVRFGQDWQSLPASTPVWGPLSYNAKGSMTRNGLSYVYQRRLGTTKVHVTRRIFAQALFAVGASAPYVQEMMGHNTLAATQCYAEQVDGQVNKFSRDMGHLLGLGEE